MNDNGDPVAAGAQLMLAELAAEGKVDALVAFLIAYRGGVTIHTTGDPGREDEPHGLCAHPGHNEDRGYRGETLAEVLLAACIDDGDTDHGLHGEAP